MNRYLRGKRINKYLVFGGGYPTFRYTPSFFKWGSNYSLIWLGVELVYVSKGSVR